MKFTSLPEWLAWLETLHPREIELGLDRIQQVATQLSVTSQLIANGTRVITIAGTNGKGSCVATSEAILSQLGTTVGAYTSPHLLKFNERIRLNGEMVSDELLILALEKIESVRNNIPLTYFEFTTLAALLLFVEAKLDVILLEVGLGGRLDAVNIIDADVAVLTSVALDHVDWLGDTREKIGWEKAGVFRGGRPAICVDKEVPESVINHAEQIGAQLITRELHWELLTPNKWRWQGLSETRTGGDHVLAFNDLPLPSLPLPSVAAAIQAVVLLGYPLTGETVSDALNSLRLAGRCQMFEVNGVNVLLDVAHNPAAAEYLATHLTGLEAKRRFAIFAVMADKDVGEIVEQLGSSFDQWMVAGLPDVPRAAKPAQLENRIKASGQSVVAYATVPAAYEAAIQTAQAGDLVVVFGSFYTVADVLALLQ